jgi:GNAT superfamily N-acetyltransferase
MVAIRTATPGDLAGLPDLEARSDTLFASVSIGPLPAPAPVSVLEAALVVLVAGEPVQGFARIDALNGGAHLEQLSVDPDHGRLGIGRALVQAACQWAREHGYRELTLATYRDVPWNGPFYASEGFTDEGPVDRWYDAIGVDPEEPVMGRFGQRILMRRRL